MEINKLCVKCGIEYPMTSEFWYINKPKDESKKTKYQCKKCKNDANNAYNEKHKASLLLKQREEYKNNPEKYAKKRETNKEKQNAYMKQWREDHPEEIKENNHRWNENNKERNKSRCKEWYEKNIDHVKQYKKTHKDEKAGERFYARYQEDLLFRLKVQLRNRLRSAIAGNYKAGSAVGDLGCSIDEFKAYMETLFKPGMSWDNWGVHGFHIDHIIPLASFDLSDRDQFLKACHYTNLRPLWSEENLKKGKIVGETESTLASIINEYGIRSVPDNKGHVIKDALVVSITPSQSDAYQIPKIKASESTRRVITLLSCEIENKRSIVASMLMHLNWNSTMIGARECEIRNLDGPDATLFFLENHLMGPHRASTAYGLYYKNECVAAMSVRMSGQTLEISRFANKLFTSVRGGFSRLLSHIEKQRKPHVVVSFCDLRYATGASYTRNGFKLQSTTQGWNWTDGRFVFNRLTCRANMDERKLTEAEHAKELGLYKIYDAGQAKYIKCQNPL